MSEGPDPGIDAFGVPDHLHRPSDCGIACSSCALQPIFRRPSSPTASKTEYFDVMPPKAWAQAQRAFEGAGGARWRHLSHPAESTLVCRPSPQVMLFKLRHGLEFSSETSGGTSIREILLTLFFKAYIREVPHVLTIEYRFGSGTVRRMLEMMSMSHAEKWEFPAHVTPASYHVP